MHANGTQYSSWWPHQEQLNKLISPSINSQQQSVGLPPPPAAVLGTHMQWNPAWQPPYTHFQRFPPPQQPLTQAQLYWPTPPPNDGTFAPSNEFNSTQHHTFQPQYHGGESLFRNTGNFQNRQSSDDGAWRLGNSVMPGMEDEDEPVEKTQRQKNQEWLNKFLAHCKQSESSEDTPSKLLINISETQIKLKECIDLSNELRTIHDNLKKLLNGDELTWNARVKQANTVKKRLEASVMDLNSLDKQSLKVYIQNRHKKRNRIKRQKLRQNEERREKEQQTKCLHEKIDAWQEAIRHSHLAAEMEKKLKKEADCILSEVRRKCAEANRMLELVKSVSKLRTLKKQAAENKGLFTTSECDENFSTSVLKLEKLLSARLAEYAEEERTLQVMLDEEHQVTRDSAIKIRQKEQKEKWELAKQQKLFYLFGPEAILDEMDPQYMYREFYTRAERNLEALIRVRQSWDVWLVPPEAPNSSGIPLTWVVPVKPSSNAWASYLEEV